MIDKMKENDLLSVGFVRTMIYGAVENEVMALGDQADFLSKQSINHIASFIKSLTYFCIDYGLMGQKNANEINDMIEKICLGDNNEL